VGKEVQARGVSISVYAVFIACSITDELCDVRKRGNLPMLQVPPLQNEDDRLT
jgi:hypothetical protein